MEAGTSTHSLIEQYLNASAGESTTFRMRMLELFAIRREGESERFAGHSDYIPNHVVRFLLIALIRIACGH